MLPLIAKPIYYVTRCINGELQGTLDVVFEGWFEHDTRNESGCGRVGRVVGSPCVTFESQETLRGFLPMNDSR
jgi:hypothetical protein